MNDYKELIVWQTAMDLAGEIYSAVKLLPKEELYGLSDQMKRAAVSIPSNIAEGYGRNTDKGFANFLYIARGSCMELGTQLILSVKLGFLSNEQTARANVLISEIRKMLTALIRKATA